MKILICVIIAAAAATIVQAMHWRKVFAITDARKQKRYCHPRHFVLSAVFVTASALLGIVPSAIQNDVVAYAFAGLVGFAPLVAIREILRISTSARLPLGRTSLESETPASLREFIDL